ncbi:MAG: hypothetical protein WBW60_11730, partial [Candidatus Sulfotelmatobacter sp.]
RAGRIGAFHEYIVIGITRDFKAPCRGDSITVVLDELQQLLPRRVQLKVRVRFWAGQVARG